MALPAHHAAAHDRRPLHRQRAHRRDRRRHRHQARRPAARPLDRPREGPHGDPGLVGVDLHDRPRADDRQREPPQAGDRGPRRPRQGGDGGGPAFQGERLPRHPRGLPLRVADGHRRPAPEQPHDRPVGDPAGAGGLPGPRQRGHQDPPGPDPLRPGRAADRRRDPQSHQPGGGPPGGRRADRPARHPRDRGEADRADVPAVRRGRGLHRAVRLRRRRDLLPRAARAGRHDVRRGQARVRAGHRHRADRGRRRQAQPAVGHGDRRAHPDRRRRGRLGADRGAGREDRAGPDAARDGDRSRRPPDVRPADRLEPAGPDRAARTRPLCAAGLLAHRADRGRGHRRSRSSPTSR